jgi:hypothetical protein
MRQRLSFHHPPYTQSADNVWGFLPPEAHERVLSFRELKRIKLLAASDFHPGSFSSALSFWSGRFSLSDAQASSTLESRPRARKSKVLKRFLICEYSRSPQATQKVLKQAVCALVSATTCFSSGGALKNTI